MKIRRCQPLLGTFVELTLDGDRESALQREADKAFQLIRGIQHSMGFHSPESDITRLNHCAHIAPLRVHPWTWHVIEHGLKLSAQTDGAFDITIAPHLVKWGYLPERRGTAPTGDWRDIELLPDSHIRFRRPLQIDLGGIAKGFAVDKAIDYFATRGIRAATVNAGGDLRTLGHQGQDVIIRDPAAPQARHHTAPMHRPAVATSAAYFSRKKLRGRHVSHIVHPRTGKPLRGDTSITIFAPTCMEADALTKAILFTPRETWAALLRSRDSLALLIENSGTRTLIE